MLKANCSPPFDEECFPRDEFRISASNTVREGLGRDKNRDRYAPRPDDAPAITDWRERLGSQAAKDI
jgi:hypothetical protein